MPTRRPWFTLLLLFALPGASAAQEPLITADTPADSATLHEWIHSDDPRLVAWAADFARRRHDAKIIAEMPDFLVHASMPMAYLAYERPILQADAISAVLDTLIQENAHVPIRAIEMIAPYFPAQASILISRLPLTESRVTLQDWTYGATGTWGGRMLARIASMLLARDPGPSRGMWDRNQMGFVASVVAASESELQITVSSTSAVGELGGWGGCGDSFSRKPPSGWPTIYDYDLVENDAQATGPVVVDLDGDRIVFRRFEAYGGWGSCNAVDDLNPYTRHRLIAYWLGIPVKEMTWQPVELRTIQWTGAAAYQRQLGEIIESQRQKLSTTVEALHQRGLMSEGEAETYAPRLVVTIHCEIKPCPLP
jgi:hypothetical protein